MARPSLSCFVRVHPDDRGARAATTMVVQMALPRPCTKRAAPLAASIRRKSRRLRLCYRKNTRRPKESPVDGRLRYVRTGGPATSSEGNCDADSGRNNELDLTQAECPDQLPVPGTAGSIRWVTQAGWQTSCAEPGSPIVATGSP